jgi:hypothetical protein
MVPFGDSAAGPDESESSVRVHEVDTNDIHRVIERMLFLTVITPSTEVKVRVSFNAFDREPPGESGA